MAKSGLWLMRAMLLVRFSQGVIVKIVDIALEEVSENLVTRDSG
jgi:DNA-directed RNA polymerase subunit K/omega